MTDSTPIQLLPGGSYDAYWSYFNYVSMCGLKFLELADRPHPHPAFSMRPLIL